jgi:hypothetical protein
MIIHERKVSLEVDGNGKLIDLVNGTIPEKTFHSIVSYMCDYKGLALAKDYSREIESSGLKELVDISDKKHFGFNIQSDQHKPIVNITVTNSRNESLNISFTYEYKVACSSEGGYEGSLIDEDGVEALVMSFSNDFEYQ